MSEKVLVTEKQTSADEVWEVTEGQVAVTEGELESVESHVFVLHAATHAASETNASEALTRTVFEDALDRVSRPVKGKYADILPSSEEFIKDKRQEVELEDR